MSIEYALQDQDYVEFTEYSLGRAKLKRISWVRGLKSVAIGAVIGVVGISVYNILQGRILDFNKTLDWKVLAMILVVVFCIFVTAGLIFFIQKGIIRGVARRRIRDGSFTKFLEPHCLELRKEGVFVSGATGTGMYPWSAIFNIEISNHALYMYLTSVQAFIVPRRVFDDAGFARFSQRARELWSAART